MPHVQTIGDQANPTQREPLKRPFEPGGAEEERKNAQTKGQRNTKLVYQVGILEEKQIVEERPRIWVILVVIPQNHDKQAEQTCYPEPGTQLLEGCTYVGRNRGMLRVHVTERQQHSHSEILEILPTNAIGKEQNAIEQGTGYQNCF